MNVLHIVILNYRTGGLVVDCLNSLAEERGPGGVDFRVTVADGCSQDGSVAIIAKAIDRHGWKDWVELMPLEQNRGFAYGNNAAIEPILTGDDPPEYFVLLNPDTVVRPGAMGTLRRFMDGRPEVGIAGSRLEFPDGTPQCSAFQFHSILSELENGFRMGWVSRLLSRWRVPQPIPKHATETGWVAGACMIIRRSVFERVGLLDDGFFMYYEEVDYCRRARDADFRVWYVPEARVVHLVGQASGVTDTSLKPRRRPAYWFESRRRYFVKHGGWLYASLADAAFALGFATWRVRRRLQRKPDNDPPHLLSDLLRHSMRSGGAQPVSRT